MAQPDLAGNGRRGSRVIAGDHFHFDAGPPACLHRDNGFGPGRVDHGLEPQEGQPPAHVFVGDRPGAFGHVAKCHGQNTQALGGQRVHLRVDDCRIQGRPRAGGGQGVDTFRQQRFDGSLQVRHGRTGLPGLMKGGHVLVFGFKGQRVDARQVAVQRLRIDSRLLRGGDQGAFGRIAVDAPAFLRPV